MLNEHYDVTTAAYAVGYESYPIWTPYGGMQIAEDYQAFNLGIGKDLGLFGAFSFDITQANTTLADGTRHSGQSVKSVYSKSFYQTGTNIQLAGASSIMAAQSHRIRLILP